jgi:hypothetical protein
LKAATILDIVVLARSEQDTANRGVAYSIVEIADVPGKVTSRLHHQRFSLFDFLQGLNAPTARDDDRTTEFLYAAARGDTTKLRHVSVHGSRRGSTQLDAYAVLFSVSSAVAAANPKALAFIAKAALLRGWQM